MLALFTIGLIIAGCTGTGPAEHTGVSVVTTFYPLYDAAREIAGANATVSSIVPNGVEPHDYDPSPSQIAGISGADVFVEAGVGFDGLEGKLRQGLGAKAVIVNASEGVSLESGGQEDGSAAGVDPHIWLSPKRMMVIADNIKNGLEKADPGNRVGYERNAEGFKARLKQLDSEYRSGLRGCKQDTILTSHNAFGYMAADYGFKQVYISGLSPDAEPSPKKIAELVDAAKKDNISYIFYEELVDPRIAQTIAGEIGAQTLELSPLEGTKNKDDDYFSVMRRNLKNLRTAMECP